VLLHEDEVVGQFHNAATASVTHHRRTHRGTLALPQQEADLRRGPTEVQL
jgi:hypothetical protein